MTRLFTFWCGDRAGGPCPLCARPVHRDRPGSWHLAHVNGAGQGGVSMLWNVFICCPACNWTAELGCRSLSASGTGGSHLDGIVGAHNQDEAAYAGQLGLFMDQLYDWLFASGRRVASDEAEDRAAVVCEYYGGNVPGGAQQRVVFDVYSRWLAVQTGLQSVRARLRAAQTEYDAFCREHHRYLQCASTRTPLNSEFHQGL